MLLLLLMMFVGIGQQIGLFCGHLRVQLYVVDVLKAVTIFITHRYKYG